MNLKFLPIMLTLVVFSTSAAARTLSLKEAIEIAVKQSPQMAAVSSATDAANAAKSGKLSGFLPQIIASETYNRTDDPVGVFGTKLRQGKFTTADFDISTLNHPGSIGNFATRLEFDQSVFASGKDLAEYKSANAQYTAQKHIESFEEQRIKYMTSNLYYTALALQKQKTALDEGIKKLKNLESSYQLMEAPTSASTSNYLVASSVRTNLESDAVKIECERKKSIRELNALLGFNPEEETILSDDLPEISSLKKTESVDDKSIKRADVLANESIVRATEEEKKSAVRKWGPDLNVFGAYNLNTNDFKDSENSYEVGARLSLPIFAWSRESNISRMRALLKQTQNEYEANKLKAAADLENSDAMLSSCIERYFTVSKAAATATKALDVAGTRYKEGTLPLLDYSQTIQNWVQMRMNLAQTHLQAATSKANYDFQRGSL